MKGLQNPYWKDIMLSFWVEVFKPKGFLSHIEKTWFFSWEHRLYIWKAFKSHIEKILCYSFKLKYLNQKIFLSHIERTWFFSWEHRVYILMSFKSHILKKKNQVSSEFAWVARVPGPGSPKFGRAVTTAGLLLNPDRSSHQVDRVPDRPVKPSRVLKQCYQ